LEFNGEENHVHLLVDAHPDNKSFLAGLSACTTRDFGIFSDL
jgi:REP element-mobilizing transposase RayT